MSWRDAPIFVEAHELACWLINRPPAGLRRDDTALAPHIAETATDLVCAVALALMFRTTRPEHLDDADREIVRLRMLASLAARNQHLAPGELGFLLTRLDVIGRMVSDWRRQLERRAPRGRQVQESSRPGATSSREPV